MLGNPKRKGKIEWRDNPQFQHADFLLIVCLMCQRIEAFTNSIITCRSKLDNTTLGETLGQVSLDQMKKATEHVIDGTECEDPVMNKLFSSVKGNCSSVGHSNEAAVVGRQKFFSMWHYMGPPAIFKTLSPDDQCSIRVKLYAINGTHKIPTTKDMMNEEL